MNSTSKMTMAGWQVDRSRRIGVKCPGKWAKVFTLLILASCTWLQSNIVVAQPVELESLTTEQIFEAQIPVADAIDLANYQWYVWSGGEDDWLGGSRNREQWNPVAIGQSLGRQGVGGRFHWYKVTFDLPEQWHDTDTLLLKLGRISLFDEVFLNGHRVGSFGAHPPDTLIRNSSIVERQYFVDGSLLREGENEMRVRVFSGFLDGCGRGLTKWGVLCSHCTSSMV